MSMNGEAKKEVETFLLNGEKTAVIKYLKDTFDLSLYEAKSYQRDPLSRAYRFSHLYHPPSVPMLL